MYMPFALWEEQSKVNLSKALLDLVIDKSLVPTIKLSTG